MLSKNLIPLFPSLIFLPYVCIRISFFTDIYSIPWELLSSPPHKSTSVFRARLKKFLGDFYGGFVSC